MYEELSGQPLHANARAKPSNERHSFELSETEQLERSTSAAKLRAWLAADDGSNVFWITGKPGSGKSTFTEFIRDHTETDALLRIWAGADRLIVADHFFGLPGTPIQNSAEGLLKSLLHQVLSYLVTDLTAARFICNRQRFSLHSSRLPWTVPELKQTIANVSALNCTRLFFVIDGLDECCPQHAHDNFLDMLLGVLKLPNVKSCVSSRPWTEFVSKLHSEPSLCLDTLTRVDMILYFRHRLEQALQGQTWCLPPEEEIVEVNQAARLMAHKAGGVFLWLVTATRAVVVELKKDRGSTNINQILEDMPYDLEEYFTELVCSRVNRSRSNVSDTASAFKLAMLLHGESMYMLEQSSFVNFWLLSRGALDSAMKFPAQDTAPLEPGRIAVILRQTRSFLEQSCKDMLVVAGYFEVDSHADEGLCLGHSVEFFHRVSVRLPHKWAPQGLH